MILEHIEQLEEWAKANLPQYYHENMPTFIIGDLNSKPGSSVMHLYTGKGEEYNHKQDLDPSLLEYSAKAKGLNKRLKFYEDI